MSAKSKIPRLREVALQSEATRRQDHATYETTFAKSCSVLAMQSQDYEWGIKIEEANTLLVALYGTKRRKEASRFFNFNVSG